MSTLIGEIGKHIQRISEQEEMSRSHLCRAVGLDHAHVSTIEAAGSNLTLAAIV